MKKHRVMIVTTMLCVLPLIYVAAVYQKLPEQLAVHWDMEGQADGYASRFWGGVGLPLLMAVINFVVHIALDHDPKRANASSVLLGIGKWCIPVLSNLVMAATLLWNLSYEIPMDKIVLLLVGLLLVIIGNYMPKTRQSYTVGIKLPWTLNSEENWKRTHHMAGYIWIFGGILLMLGCVIPMGLKILLPAILVILVAVPCLYSFWLYRNGI